MNIGRIVVLIGVLMMAMNSFSQEAPKGKLIYCSYSKNGHAGLGKSYCELIADEGKEPQIVVSLYNDCHFRDAVKKTFTVTAAEVEKMRQLLEKGEVYKLDGYNHDEQLEGGATYRIYQEYLFEGTVIKVNATWSGHEIKPEAMSAYAMIENFFDPWREQVETKD